MSALDVNSRPGFAARVRQLRSRRYEEWFHIVFTGPVGTILAAAVAEVRWITPNLLTLLSFVGRLACCWLVLERSWAMDIATVVLIHVTLIPDVMDASLARYRKTASYFGAFFDKITDSIALCAILWAVGYRVVLDTGEVAPLMVAIFIGVSFISRAHMFWLTNYFEFERDPNWKKKASALPGPGELSAGERLRYYLRSTYRLFAVMAAEVYLGLSIGLVIEELSWTLYILGAPVAAWYLIILVGRVRQVRALDRPA